MKKTPQFEESSSISILDSAQEIQVWHSDYIDLTSQHCFILTLSS